MRIFLTASSSVKKNIQIQREKKTNDDGTGTLRSSSLSDHRARSSQSTILAALRGTGLTSAVVVAAFIVLQHSIDSVKGAVRAIEYTIQHEREVGTIDFI